MNEDPRRDLCGSSRDLRVYSNEIVPLYCGSYGVLSCLCSWTYQCITLNSNRTVLVGMLSGAACGLLVSLECRTC